ncbi:unnamed protein product [Diatraea saccharalis]|uniref:Sulfotransferase domain-containing protein n=1 Tax=Diatraea saccharalis TaxID=40085 RepID=A0A9N9QTS8_9NEOP|nr:unnamed protein product [Diatraea saccharalis]
MFRRLNFYSICFAFGLSVLLILAGSRYTDNINYHSPLESRKTIRNYLRIEDGEDNLVQPLPTNPYDGSPNIDKILEKTRNRIRSELSNYNFSNSGVNGLEELLMESGGTPIRSLIVSTWRSGSTFFGELLNAMPGTYYHYEPFLWYDIIQIRGPPYSYKALKYMKNLMNCDHDGMPEIFEFGKGHLHAFSHNTRLWDHCKYNKELCLDPDFTTKMCKLFPFQSMKVVRVRLRLIEELLEDKELNLKVVLLVRDPRGVMQSRQHRSFCQPAPDCWSPELVCADMISDYVAASRFMEKYPDRLMALRYEELALDPNGTAHKVLKFLRLGMTQSVEEFLHTHTTVEVAGVSSTFRVSSAVPFKWKTTLLFNYVDEIQTACKEAMSLWGYKMVNNASQMTSKDFYPLEPYTITQ